jgi:hypothetical protein
MFKPPSEEMISAAISEGIACAAVGEEGTAEHLENCEYCQYSKHLNDLILRKSKEEGQVYCAAVDQSMAVLTTRMVTLPIIMAVGELSELVTMARWMFILGVRVGRNMATDELLQDSFVK